MIEDPRMLCGTKKKKEHEFKMTSLEERSTARDNPRGSREALVFASWHVNRLLTPDKHSQPARAQRRNTSAKTSSIGCLCKRVLRAFPLLSSSGRNECAIWVPQLTYHQGARPHGFGKSPITTLISAQARRLRRITRIPQVAPLYSFFSRLPRSLSERPFALPRLTRGLEKGTALPMEPWLVSEEYRY